MEDYYHYHANFKGNLLLIFSPQNEIYLTLKWICLADSIERIVLAGC